MTDYKCNRFHIECSHYIQAARNASPFCCRGEQDEGGWEANVTLMATKKTNRTPRVLAAILAMVLLGSAAVLVFRVVSAHRLAR